MSPTSRMIRVFSLVFGISLAITLNSNAQETSPQPALATAASDAQKRVVKLYGAGGLSGLEAYQSGFIVSPEGHIATAWSYVLNVEPVVVLDDGRRFESKIVGFEPALELAVLKIEATDLPYFKVSKDAKAQWGDPVIAVSNLFGIATGKEHASVMQGSVAAITDLDARRGTFKTPFRGKVMILDLIANNPGAAGGALVSAEGKLIGMLGKELRDAATGVWLNYALPSAALREAIADIIAGRNTKVVSESKPKLARDKSHNMTTLGIIMIPDVLETTPAYVDHVAIDSAAASAGVRPDDLILMIAGRPIKNQRGMRDLLRTIDRRDEVEVTVRRDAEIVPLVLQP